MKSFSYLDNYIAERWKHLRHARHIKTLWSDLSLPAFMCLIIRGTTRNMASCPYLSSQGCCAVKHKAYPTCRKNIWLTACTRRVTAAGGSPHGGHFAMWRTFLRSHARKSDPLWLLTGVVLHISLRKVLRAKEAWAFAWACDLSWGLKVSPAHTVFDKENVQVSRIIVKIIFRSSNNAKHAYSLVHIANLNTKRWLMCDTWHNSCLQPFPKSRNINSY